MNVKLRGITEEIVEEAVKKGLAKTKTDAIILGLVELDNRYHLTRKKEDLEDLLDAQRILRELEQQKQKLITLEEFQKQTKTQE